MRHVPVPTPGSPTRRVPRPRAPPRSAQARDGRIRVPPATERRSAGPGVETAVRRRGDAHRRAASEPICSVAQAPESDRPQIDDSHILGSQRGDQCAELGAAAVTARD
eukprot:CAMPEP_0174311126 /NCGR_PEP_ID=MMETSP0810-20121108/3516_1 /TAXON_ID=73025 ORGANISM="Eutreptiella gymnastica-like, Strain CCMP1594" /NCGR_SAMPLE_ID=MMETSP0810 /ASSEMBLY_ACC=CAM_ASM_000659 /LENGTH=107 /DNA_ID=CAMNT_0015419283 /DNA_START=863 /DNA_END=1187 /DNA_ORIENTATION=+